MSPKNITAAMPTIDKVKKQIGRRLQQEIQRKGPPDSQSLGLNDEVISGYLSGSRDISFDELRRICHELDLDLMWLLSPDYTPPQVIYRSIGRSFRQKLTEIENVMILVADLMPKPECPSVNTPPPDANSAVELICHARDTVNVLRYQYADIPDLFLSNHLPVLAIQLEASAFDGCLLHLRDRFLVVVNRNKPPRRLAFSLLHEFAHFIFDAKKNIPVDVDVFSWDFYRDVIRDDLRHEFLANKFAQYWLVPWEEAERWAMRWPDPDAALIDAFLRRHPVSLEVVANAIYDVLRNRPGNRFTYTAIRDRLRELVGKPEPDAAISEFIDAQKCDLTRMIADHLEEFDASRLAQIRRAWQLDIATS